MILICCLKVKTMFRKKIELFLDFDNTLVNTNQSCIDILNERYNTSFQLNQLHRYDFRDLWPISNEEVESLFESSDLFDRLSYIDNCYESLYGIRKEIIPYIVSSGTKKNAELKRKWILKHDNGLFDTVSVVPRHNDKKIFDMSNGIFIDDHIECLRASNAKVKILYKFFSNGDWNKYDNKDEIYVANTWKEIMGVLNFYIDNGGII